jgi:hypothetical protein
VLHFARSADEALAKLADGIRPQLIVILSDTNARLGIRQLAGASQPTRRKAVTKGRRPSNRDPVIDDNASKPIRTKRGA